MHCPDVPRPWGLSLVVHLLPNDCVAVNVVIPLVRRSSGDRELAACQQVVTINVVCIRAGVPAISPHNPAAAGGGVHLVAGGGDEWGVVLREICEGWNGDAECDCCSDAAQAGPVGASHNMPLLRRESDTGG